MSGSKLVENLAESLVNELSESKTLDLMNDQKFSEFTDLLYEILDRQMKEEDKEKEKEKEEPAESVKELTDKINKYFEQLGGGGNAEDLSFKTDRILSIVSKLLMKQNAGDSDKKKDEKKPESSSEKGKNEVEEANKKKEEEKKEQQKVELDKQTVLMLKKLTKDFEESEKKKQKENAVLRRGLKRVERKIGSFIWKALNKFKGLLLIGALIFFRKPIIDFFKKIWKDYIKPHVEPLIEKLGEMIGGLWNDFVGWFEGTFPDLDNWIKNEFPKVRDWFKKNWESIKTWFSDTIPTLLEGLSNFMENNWLGRKLKQKINDNKADRYTKQAREIVPDGDWSAHAKKDELLMKSNQAALTSLESRKKQLEGRGAKYYMLVPGAYLTWLSDKKELKDINEKIIKRNEAATWYQEAIRQDNENSKMFGDTPPDMSEYERHYYLKDPRSDAEKTLPEDDNPDGGLGSQSSINDALTQEGKTMFDFGKQIINYSPYNQVTKNYFQAAPSKLHK